MTTNEIKTVYYADCDQFDNHATGYYATAAEAEKAFRAENFSFFSASELKRVQVYSRAVEATDELIEQAKHLLEAGSPSPALGLYLS